MQIKILNLKNKWSIFQILILLCFLILLYGNSLFNEFTMDDHILISDNYLIRNLKFLPKFFKRSVFDTGCFYRPLFQVFLMAEYFFFKLNTFGYHFVNILLHFLNCLLFFRIINLLFDDYNLSVLSTLLFALHPIHNTIINQGVGSEVLLAGMCMLLSIISFTEFLLKNKSKFYYLSLVFLVIALFIRENAMLLPFYLFCFAFFYFKRNNFRRSIYLTLPFFICSFGYFLFRWFFFSLKPAIFNEFTKSFTLLEYISGFLRLILLYLYSIFFPKGIVWMWNIQSKEGLFNTEVIVFMLISLAAVYMALRYWKKNVYSFSLAWFLIGALPIILMISCRYSLGLGMEPQWLYLSSMGIFLLISVFLLKLKKYINSRLWLSLIIAILLFYSVETMAYNYLWRNPKTYYQYWLSKYPNEIARFNLANIYAAEGRNEDAKLLYRQTLSRSIFKKENNLLFNSGTVSQIYNNLGKIYYDQNKLNEAFILFSKAIEISPNSLSYLNRANIFLKDNKINEAISDFKKAIESDPYNLYAHSTLAILYAKVGNEDKAVEEYLKATDLDKNCFK